MELTTDHLKWVKRYINTVRSPGTPNIDLEDLAQEGWLAMWQALEKAKRDGREINEAYLKQAARWAVLNTLNPQRNRWPDIPLEPAELPDSVTYQPDKDLEGHREEILAAVRDLPEKQREYVYLRFWAGKSTKTEMSGYSTSLWYNPRTGAKATLKDKLGHLADAF